MFRMHRVEQRTAAHLETRCYRVASTQRIGQCVREACHFAYWDRQTVNLRRDRLRKAATSAEEGNSMLQTSQLYKEHLTNTTENKLASFTRVIRPCSKLLASKVHRICSGAQANF